MKAPSFDLHQCEGISLRNVQIGFGTQIVSYLEETGVLTLGRSGRSAKLTTCVRVVPEVQSQ